MQASFNQQKVTMIILKADEIKLENDVAEKESQTRSLADAQARIEKRKMELAQQSLEKQEEARKQLEAKLKAEEEEKAVVVTSHAV